MKKILIILLFGFLFLLAIIRWHLNKPKEIFVSAEPQIENVIVNENILSEIEIYDIEEGYLTVPYNAQAKAHNFNWNNLYIDSNGYYSYSDENYNSILGIDVSKFQGNIDWKKVSETGIKFAIIRLGFRGYGNEGNLVLDSSFKENIIGADKAGIKIGVYFFSQAITEAEAIEEAYFVLDNIKDTNITYPVCFDLEKIKYDTARTDNLSSEQITNITLAFCKEIQKAGYTPLVYGNAKTFTTRMNLEKLNNYQKWYADYQKVPLYPYEFSFWQYTETGCVNGINGNVDINLQFVPKENR